MKVLRPNFEKRGGLVAVVVQCFYTRRVLMLAYTDEAGYFETLQTGKAVYFSTSRNKRWMKGEEKSGNFQIVHQILVDCDGDALIYMVEQLGSGTCHTGALTCFYRTVAENDSLFPAPDTGEEEELPVIETEAHSRLLKMHIF